MLRLPLRTRGLTIGLLAFLSVIAVRSQAPPTALPSEPLIFAGSGPGSGELRIFQANGTPLVTISPFGGAFTGGVRVAAGDLNGDGITDVVAGMASGGGEVRAYSGTDGASLGVTTPFGAGLTGGVFVATGDVNADGHDDLLLGAGNGGGLARLIDGATQTELGSGLPFSPTYTGGVTVAMGDVTGDGRAELIFGTAVGGFVRVLDGTTLSELASGFPYGPLFFGGVNVAAGDVNGDGIDEVAIAPRNAGGPVRVYTLQAELLIEGTPFSGVQGVSVALADLNNDGRDDLVMGAGTGAQPRVRAFSILDRTQMLDLLAFDAAFIGGVNVATPSSTGTRFTSANSATFTVGAPGTFSVTTSNGTDTVLSVGGTLPSGITFTDHGNGTATLAGTAAAGTGGSYALNFVATRGAGQVASQPFTLTVQQGAAFSSGDSAMFAVGGTNVFTVTTTGQPTATTMTATGALPAGVTFTNNGNGTATLSGAPSPGSEGTYPLALSASNGIGSPAAQTLTLTVVAGTTPLFSSANAATFAVGAVGSFSVLTSATPVAGSITMTGALPAGVTFTNHGNGTATLAGLPDAGTAGTYPLVLTADNGVAATPQNFTLTVDPVAGGAPRFTSANAIALVTDTAGTFTVTTTGFPMAATLSSSGALPAGVTFTNNGNGTATLAGTATAGTAGTYPLQFSADNGVSTATQLFTLTISNVSPTPVFTSGATTARVIGTAGSFAITTAANPAVTSIALTGGLPTGMTFTDNGDGTATLAGTPQAGTGGPYALTFTATNGGAPVAQAFTLSVQETAAVTSANARAFTVGIADSFTVTTAGLPVPSVTLTGALPTGVTYTDNGDGTGTIAGTAAGGTVGSYPLTLTATNGVGTPGAQAFTLNVTQNTPPTLDAIPDPAAILEDAAQQTINLTGISAGVGDSQPLGVTAQSSDPSVIPHPTVTYATPNATGTLHYTPVPNAFGSAIMTVTVSDGGLDNDLGTLGDNGVFSRTFTVAVTSVNDAPTLDAIANPAAIDEDAAQQTVNLSGISTGGGETQALQVTATSDTLGLIPNPTVTYVAPAATGSLAYTPVPGESGSAIVTVTVTDGGDDNDLGTTGDNLTVTRTFTVVVNDVDDAPTLDAITDPAAINEDAGLQTVNLSGISAGAGETATLIVTALSGNPALIPHPTVTYTSPNATGSLSYTPVANTSGSAVITVTVSDGGATPTQRTFTVVVNDVNDAPTFTPGGNQTVSEDALAQTVNGFLGTVSAGANEAGQIVTVTINNVTNGSLFTVAPAISATGVLTYTPAPEQFGTSTVTYTVSDNGGTANGGVDSVGPLTFTITINAVNDPPTLNAISDPSAILEDAAQQTVNLAGIGSGSSGESAQPLQITAVSGNTSLIPNPTVTYVSPNATGSLAYTPVANAFGTAVVTVTITDGGLDNNLGTTGDNGTLVRTFTVAVTSVNDAPSFTKGGDQTVNEDAGAQTVNPWATGISAGPGEGAQILTFEITGNTNAALFSAGPTVSPSTGNLTYTPAANQNGTATITLRITDNGGTANGGVDASAAQTFVITVNAVNDPPVPQAKSFNAQANMQIQGLTGFLTGVVDADAGVNGCNPTFTLTGVGATSPAGGTVTITDAANGIVTFDPPPGVTGNVTFSYTVTDTGCPMPAQTGMATATVSVAGPVVWFVDSTAPGGGDGTWSGTNAKAFQTLAQAAAVDASDHRIFVLNNSGSSINYAGGIALNTGEWLVGQGATGASFDGVMGIAPPLGTVARPGVNGVRPTFGGTVQMNTQSASNIVRLLGFNLSTGASMALTNGGTTINGVTVTLGSVATTTGTAVSVTGVNNGSTVANAMTFVSVSANGAPNGIVLSNTVGTFTVTGDAGSTQNGSGGTLQNITNDGISLTNAQDVSFDQMSIQTTGGSGVNGTLVTNFAFTNGTVNGAGSAGFESAIAFNGSGTGVGNNLNGIVTITGNSFTNPFYSGFDLQSDNGTLTNATISNNTITNPGFSGVNFVGTGSASTVFALNKATIASNSVTGSGGNGIQISIGNSSATGPGATAGIVGDVNNIISIAGNTVSLDPTGTQAITVANSGGNTASRTQTNFAIQNNPSLLGSNIGTVVLVGNNGFATMTGIVHGNVIDANHQPNFGGGNGIGGGNGVAGAGNAWTPDLTLTVTSNTITDTDGNGILLVSRGTSGTARLKVQNNSVAAPINVGGFASYGIRVDAGNGQSADDAVCVNMSGNSSAGSNGGTGIGFRKEGSASTTNDFSVHGMAATSTPGVETYVNGLNPSGGGTLLISATTGFSNCSLP